MKIAFVENIDPYREPTGGIGIYLKYLTRFLNDRGIETILIGASGQKGGDLKIPVTRFIDVASRNVGHPGYLWRLFAQIRRMSFEPDVIFHGQRPDVLFPIIFFKKNFPYMCTLHGVQSRSIYFKKGRMQGRFFEWLEKYTLRRTHSLVAVAPGSREHFTGRYPFCKDKITTIPTGVDFSSFFPMNGEKKARARKSFGFTGEDKIILFVGRLEVEKNLVFLMDVFAEVKQRVPAGTLVLAGIGRQEERLRAYARSRGLADVTFLGPVANDRVPDLLNCADVFTLCSFYEGSPIVVKEALACNVPVVSMDVGDVRILAGGIKGDEDADGCGCERGIFIAKHNVHGFSEAVTAVLGQEKTYSPREYIEDDYKNEKVFERTLEIYRRLNGGAESRKRT